MIVISGRPIKQARFLQHDDGIWFGDDPRMCHQSEKHDEISWASCFCDRCLDHLEDKVKHNCFPRRYRTESVPNPYLKDELRYWTVRSRVEEAPYIILRPDPKYPWLCRAGGLRRECTTVICAYHARGKIEDWHEVGGHDEIERLREIQRQAFNERIRPGLERDEVEDDAASSQSGETLTEAGNGRGPL